MKIIVASFQCESNSKAKIHPTREDFEYFKGNDIFKKLVVKDIFEENGFEAVPSIYAVALPSGTVERNIYEDYKEQIMQTVREIPMRRAYTFSFTAVWKSTKSAAANFIC